jgi:hypothetical protein
MKISFLLTSGLVVLAGVLGRAAETVRCPDSITTHQELASPVAGWAAMLDDTPHQLAAVTFYDGPPAEKASLVYDHMTSGQGEQTATWTFAQPKGRAIWLACSYAGTAVQLSRSLPPQITICSITYDAKQQIAGLPVIKRISCR